MKLYKAFALGAVMSLSSMAFAQGPAVTAAYRLQRATASERTENHTYTTNVSYMHEDGPAVLRVQMGGSVQANQALLHAAKQATVDALRAEGFKVEEKVTEAQGSRALPGGRGTMPMTWTHYEVTVSR